MDGLGMYRYVAGASCIGYFARDDTSTLLRTRHTTRSFLALRVYRLPAPALLFIAAMYRSAADICAPPPGGEACEPPAPGGPTLCAGILALAARSAAESGGLLGPAPGFAGPAPLALAIAPGAVGFGLLAPPKLAGIAPAPLEPLLFLLCCPASSAPLRTTPAGQLALVHSSMPCTAPPLSSAAATSSTLEASGSRRVAEEEGLSEEARRHAVALSLGCPC